MLLQILPHAATLPCKMLMYGKAVQKEVNAIIDLTTINCVATLLCEMLMSCEAV